MRLQVTGRDDYRRCIDSKSERPGCPLWPWKMTKDPTGEMHRFAHVPIYIIFDIEGDETGGSVVEVDGLFQIELADPQSVFGNYDLACDS